MVGVAVEPCSSGERAVRIALVLTVALKQERFVEHFRRVEFDAAGAIAKILVYDNLVEEVPATPVDV